MATPNSAAKAVIRNKTKGVNFDCQFAPETFSLEKQNEWGEKKSQDGKETRTFHKSKSADFSIELWFDTLFDTANGGTPENVRTRYTDKLFALLDIDSGSTKSETQMGLPPTVVFMWGGQPVFEGVVKSIHVNFVLFWSDGRPIRAKVKIVITQDKKAGAMGGQNPTSGGPGGNRVWTVTEGETLGYIAHRELGKTARWRDLAELNGLEDVRDLRAGMRLLIPHD